MVHAVLLIAHELVGHGDKDVSHTEGPGLLVTENALVETASKVPINAEEQLDIAKDHRNVLAVVGARLSQRPQEHLRKVRTFGRPDDRRDSE